MPRRRPKRITTASGLEDSGRRMVYPSGAMKEPQDINKGRYDLIPVHPHYRLAVCYARGAIKYQDRNWEKGLPFSRLICSAKSHIEKFLAGKNAGDDHLAAAVFNLFAIMEFQYRYREGKIESLNDLPDAPSHPPEYLD